MSDPAPKKRPCPDCTCCQWCSDERCRICLNREGCRRRNKLSMTEQIALYDFLNRPGSSRVKE
ncbi:MAG: hypothetical protein PHR66_07650 [Desulfuromonadaceae bacterium]|nr:hypothetical protein [Desulfuromonadaceae bacterium]